MSKHNKHSALPLRWESAELNNWTFNHYFYTMLELAVNSFEWINLPDEIDARFLEYLINVNGYALFFRDDVADAYVAANASLGGNLNIYHVPEYRRAFAPNGYNYECTPENSVIIYNNYLRTPTYGSILYYSKKLYAIERTLDTEIFTARIPAFIACEESQRLTMENLMMKYDGNIPLIFGNKNFDMSSLKVLDLKPNDKGEKMERLYTMKRKYWYEALAYLGIDTANEEKKERLITAEVERGNSLTEQMRYTRLNARRNAAKQINKMFGLEIEVNYREQNTTTMEVFEDVNLYNGAALSGGEKI